MNKTTDEHKKRLIINISLMALTLFTLVCCVFAWFSSMNTALVDDLSVEVHNMDVELLSPIEKIIFPCATKISECSEAEFVKDCSETRVYVLRGAGEVSVDVNCIGPGMLGYVCEKNSYPTSGQTYYDELKAALSSKLGSKAWTYENIKSALDSINNRNVGVLNANGNTEVMVVYWVEYTAGTAQGANESLLENPNYWNSDFDKNHPYSAEIIFTR